jgi:hypothetical protein
VFLQKLLVLIPLASVAWVVIAVWGVQKVVAWLLSLAGWCQPLKLADELERRLK